MAGRNIHVVPSGDVWAVKPEGNPFPTSTHATYGAAIDAGRELARRQGSELLIHRPDGRIRDRDSYGNDPFPPRG